MAKITGLVLLLFALVVCSAADTCAQTTAFTYQGSLKEAGLPANANYDFEFLLFDASTGGNQVGPTNTVIGIPVTNGIFSVRLDFGNQFSGANRFMEIRVRPTGQPGITTLGPRQSMDSAPYSIRTLNAESAATATTATNATQLGGFAANQYLLTNGNGSGLTNLNAGNITTGTLAIANGGTGSSTKNFVDLSTNQTSIGGNKTFTGNLTVSGFGGVRTNVNSDSNAGLGLSLSNAPKWSVATVNPGQFQIFNDAIGQNAFWIDPTNNNVGIGSATPGATLEVGGYTKLGSDAPSIRVKKLTGTTAANEGGSVLISHGLNSSKILSITAMVNYSGQGWIGTSYQILPGYNFNWLLIGPNIEIDNAAGGSANILSKPVKLLVTYEQ